MILGILSDSHGRARITATAVAMLQQFGATALAHCGDVGSDDVLDELIALPSRFVWGNTDYPDGGLRHYAVSLGLVLPDRPPVRWTLAGKHIAIYHGHEAQFDRWLRQHDTGGNGADHAASGAAASGGAATADAPLDYILYGHTHVAADARVGGVRLINPGALHRAHVHTIATLNLETDELTHWVVPPPGAPSGPPQRYTV